MQPGALVVNGYNRTFAPAAVLTERTARLRPARGWAGLGALPAGAPPPLETAWRAGEGGDSLFALFTGANSRYDRVHVGLRRDLAQTVRADRHAEETALPLGRPLARHFSAPRELRLADGGARAYLRARLFDLADDASRFVLFVPAMNVVQANRP